MNSGEFVFRKNVVIGAAAAENDGDFLVDCFIDNGDLQTLRDLKDHRRIVLGRTGSGKSALLLKLRESDQTIWIDPHTLALNYISNSNVLRFFENAGVNLSPFYKLLWKHVLTVELLRRHNHLEDEKRSKSFLESLLGAGKKDAKTQKAMKYLVDYGDKFWEGTEFRIKEIVSKVEQELKGSVGAKIGEAKFDVSGAKKLSDEQRQEIIHRGQEVVSRFQVRDLQDVLEVLATDLLQGVMGYYVVIDRLDEDWVDDVLQYKLIRALIDTSVEFKRVSQVKVLLGVRHDLLEAVLTGTRDKGYQEEKYVNLCLNVRWGKGSLIELVNRRIDKVIKDQYTNVKVTHKDVFPETKKGNSSIHYILGRTADRPRDLIVFFNLCLSKAVGRPTITRAMILEAEAEYSRGRLTALADEWQTLYPHLDRFADLLRDRKAAFILREIEKDKIAEFCVNFVINTPGAKGKLYELAKQYAEDKITVEDFRIELCKALYRVGMLAVKPATQEKFQWMDEIDFSLTTPTITEDTRVQIHPAYWRTLNTNVPKTME